MTTEILSIRQILSCPSSLGPLSNLPPETAHVPSH